MLPNYPTSTFTLPTLTTSDHPQAAHINLPGRELEAIATELGTTPKTVDETVVPPKVPISAGAVLSALAAILKALSGKAHWYSAVAWKSAMFGSGGGSVIGTGATVYVYFGGSGLSATEIETQSYVPNNCKVVSMRARLLLTAQPATGSLVFTLRKNGVDTAVVITFAAGAAAGTIQAATGSIAYVGGTDYFTVKVVNNAATNSAQVGGVTLEINQTG